jgi:16S rRNA (cytosine967-C5)-methyltransferase
VARRQKGAPSARLIAVRVLRHVDRHQGHSNRALSEQLERYPDLDPRDRGLATILVYGVLRHRARLDHLIDAGATRPHKIRGELREVLRIAAYELRELERPAHVAISEAARLGRHLDRRGGLDGVIHAVLGNIDREGNALDADSESSPFVQAMERRWSVPAWLAGRWQERLGAERALARARAISLPPTVDVRIDLSRTDADTVRERLQGDHGGISIEAVDGQPQALRLRGGGDVFHGPLHDEGLISVQALAAQQPVRLLAPQPGERVLDACAGMGTKTLQIAELMQRRGTLVAVDLDRLRLAELEELSSRGHLDAAGLSLSIVEGDLTGDEIQGVDDVSPFDAVLVDAPCTGLGNLARHPEIRWRSRTEDIEDRAALQRALLEGCLARVRSGGRLVYVVCSLEPEEGPDVVAHLVKRRGAALREEHLWTPEDHASDGFYFALLEPS